MRFRELRSPSIQREGTCLERILVETPLVAKARTNENEPRQSRFYLSLPCKLLPIISSDFFVRPALLFVLDSHRGDSPPLCSRWHDTRATAPHTRALSFVTGRRAESIIHI